MDYNIELEGATMEAIVLHKVGNKRRDEGMRIAKDCLELDEDFKHVMKQYFFKSFKIDKVHEFNHEHDLSMNKVHNCVSKVFSWSGEFYEQSIEILKHLYDKSNHVSINGGEVYLCYFKDIIVDDELVDGIGIFKSENKETFLKLKLDEKEEWTLDLHEGINTTKIDKGCIILNVEQSTGFRVLSIDLKSSDAKFWTDDFLKITQVRDHCFHTRAFMELCSEFAKTNFDHTELMDRVEFMNKSRDYFEHYKEFDEAEFKEIMFEGEPEHLEKFEALKEVFLDAEKIDEDLEEPFTISSKTAKNTRKIMKNRIKLDTQIEIKVDSSIAHAEEFIEQGYDEERDMKYYKIYFNNQKQ